METSKIPNDSGPDVLKAKRYTTLEQSYSELNTKYSEVVSICHSLEKKLMRVQATLDHERTMQNQVSEQTKELNEIQATLEQEKCSRNLAESRLLEAEKNYSEILIDNSQFKQRVSTLCADMWSKADKRYSTLEQSYSELDTKYSEVVSIRHSLEKELMNVQATLNPQRTMQNQVSELTKELNEIQATLEQEKHSRNLAESRLLEAEKKNSELLADISQFKQQISTLCADIRSEADKSKNLSLQIELEIQRRDLMQTDFRTQSQDLAKAKTVKKRLSKKLQDAQEAKRHLEEELRLLKEDMSANNLQMKELQDQLAAEKHFSSVYRTQVDKMKEDIEDKMKSVNEQEMDLRRIEKEKESLAAQLKLALSKADSEHLARSVAEKQLSDIEKEREIMSRQKSDIGKKESQMRVELQDAQEENGHLEEELRHLKEDMSVKNLQMKELQDQLATEKYFCSVYRTQVNKLKEDIEDKMKSVNEQEMDLRRIEKEKESLAAQLKLALSKADSEHLARSVAVKQLSDIEKEKEIMSWQKSDTGKKESQITMIASKLDNCRLKPETVLIQQGGQADAENIKVDEVVQQKTNKSSEFHGETSSSDGIPDIEDFEVKSYENSSRRDERHGYLNISADDFSSLQYITSASDKPVEDTPTTAGDKSTKKPNHELPGGPATTKKNVHSLLAPPQWLAPAVEMKKPSPKILNPVGKSCGSASTKKIARKKLKPIRSSGSSQLCLKPAAMPCNKLSPITNAKKVRFSSK